MGTVSGKLTPMFSKSASKRFHTTVQEDEIERACLEKEAAVAK